MLPMRQPQPKPALIAALDDYFAQRQDAMLATLRELVELESPSSDKAAVDKLGALLAAKFIALGGKVTLHRNPHYGDHLQADFAADRTTGGARALGAGLKPVLLLGHFDTVWALGTLARMPFRAEKARAFGPGIYDMKAGIVMMLSAIQGLREMSLREVSGGLPWPVTVLLVTDEEVGSESSRAITEGLARRSAAVLVLEPAQGPRGALKTARKGVGDYRVRVTGRASHSGVDFEKGHSAILELARHIETISRFTDLKRGLTVNPGVIRGGTRTNVVAAEAEVEVDVRIARAADARLIEKKFRALKAKDRHCKLAITGGVNRPPMERSAGVAALYELARGLGGEIGWKVEEAATGGGSDGNFTAALGVPTLDGLGAAGEGAHAINESIVLAELPRRTALVAALLAAI